MLTSDKKIADYFELGLKVCSNARNLCNWIIVEFAGRLKDTGKTILDTGIPPEHVGKLVNMIEQNTITGKIAKSVADDMMKDSKLDPEKIVAANPDYQPIHDYAEIEACVDQVIRENAQSVEDFRAGRDRAFGFLVGQAMKLSRGKASPAIVNELLRNKLK